MILAGCDGPGKSLKTDYSDIKTAVLASPGDNLLINGGMMVAQRGTSFDATTTPANSDDTYLLDRWILLSDGNDIVDVSQSTDAPTGSLNSIALDVETANKKFGILQIIEQKNAVGVIGDVVSLSFWAKADASISNVKAVVLSWDSTADTVTSDVVSAWGADGVTPTWATNWTAENTPANLSVGTSWAEHTIENISVNTASTTNIAVFIWCDDLTTTITEVLYITHAKLELGATSTTFVEQQNVLALCQRFYFVRTPSGVVYTAIGMGQYYTASMVEIFVAFPVSMRVTPTFLHGTGTNYFQALSAGVLDDFDGLIMADAFSQGCRLYTSTGVSGTAGNAMYLRTAHASAFVAFDAEL